MHLSLYDDRHMMYVPYVKCPASVIVAEFLRTVSANRANLVQIESAEYY